MNIQAKEDDKSVRTNNFTSYITRQEGVYPYNMHETLKIHILSLHKQSYSWRLKIAVGIVPHHMITKDDK